MLIPARDISHYITLINTLTLINLAAQHSLFSFIAQMMRALRRVERNLHFRFRSKVVFLLYLFGSTNLIVLLISVCFVNLAVFHIQCLTIHIVFLRIQNIDL